MCLSASVYAQTLRISGIAVYDIETGEAVSGQTVTIVDGLIVDIERSVPRDESSTATGIDGSGLTLMPGLIDSHVHMTEKDIGAFLANGVTAIRELNGSPDHLALRDSINAGEVVGPRMLVSSPLVSGREITFRHELLTSKDDAEALVSSLVDAGYDYLKIYDDLERASYEQIVTAAGSLDLDIVGHLPRAVGLAGVLLARQSIEHNEKIVVDVLGFDYSDLSPLDRAAGLIASSGVSVTPTLAVHEFMSDRRGAEVQSRIRSDEMAYVDDGILAWWKSTFPSTQESYSANTNGQAFMHAQRYLLQQLWDHGVPILAGTDTPNPLMVPGFSLHDELEALTRGGLSNEAAIRAATVTPGRKLKWTVPVGEVKVGFAADLLLVRGKSGGRFERFAKA